MKTAGITLVLLLFSLFVRQDIPPLQQAEFTFTSTDRAADQIAYWLTEWQPDSQSFTFFVNHLDADTTFDKYQYFVTSRELRKLDSSRCQLIFPAQQAEAFAAVGCAASVSSDQRLVIYPLAEQVCGETDCSNLLALGDLSSDSYAVIRKPSDTGYYVRWSEDSSALLIFADGHYGCLGSIYYVPVPSTLSLDAEIQPALLANYPCADRAFVDISPDGKSVLVRELGGSGLGLRLWSSSMRSSGQQFAALADGQPILSDENVAGATFLSDGNQYILSVTDQGIIRYDLDSHEMAVINPNVNTDWLLWAYFSPDGRYVVTFSNMAAGDRVSLFSVE